MGTVKRAFWPGVVVVMALLGIGSRVLDARVGLPYWGWEAIAIAVVVLVLVAIVVGFQRRLDAYEAPNKTVNSGDDKFANATESELLQKSRTLEMADWMERTAQGDASELGSRMAVWEATPILNLKTSPPYIDFVFPVRNGSVFDVTIGREIDGHIMVVPNRTLIAKPELSASSGYHSPLGHGVRREVGIRQFLDNDDLSACLAYKEPNFDNAPVPFDFGNLNVWVEALNGHGFSINRARLNLPTRVYIPVGDLVRSR